MGNKKRDAAADPYTENRLRKDVNLRKLSTMKASQVRKLRERVLLQFADTDGALADDEFVASLFPSKGGRVASGTLSNGAGVFVVDDLPVFFCPGGAQGDLLPTVPLLASHSALFDALPHVLIHASVSKPLLRGSHLFMPGTFPEPLSQWSRIRQGQVVVVRVDGQPIPFAVGVLFNIRLHDCLLWYVLLALQVAGDGATHLRDIREGLDVSDGVSSDGVFNVEGVAVHVLHRYGDALCKLAKFTSPPNAGFAKKGYVLPIEAQLARASAAAAADDDVEHSDQDEQEQGEAQEEAEENELEIPVVEGDERLVIALALALKNLDKDPVEATEVYNEMRRLDSSLDVKRSSFGKLQKLLQHAQKKLKWLRVLQKKQVRVSSIDWNAQSLQEAAEMAHLVFVQGGTAVDDVSEVSSGGSGGNFTDEQRKESDELLLCATNTALKYLVRRSDLPIKASIFLNSFVTKAMPPEMAETFNMKQTSHGKFARFLRKMEKRGLLRLYDADELSLRDFDDTLIGRPGWPLFDRTQVEAWQRHYEKLERKARAKAEAAKQAGRPKWTVKTLFRPSNKLAPFFKATEMRGLLTLPECREGLMKYLREHNDLLNGPNVLLDETLRQALFLSDKGKPQSAARASEQATNAPPQITRKELADRFCARLQRFNALVNENDPLFEPEYKCAAPPSVQITVIKNRGRRKFVTAVTLLENFNIVPDEFAELVRYLSLDYHLTRRLHGVCVCVCVVTSAPAR
ncbi:MAG: hypothetical protein MHM6MM_001738 [Cercozoa sp. M6MM]